LSIKGGTTSSGEGIEFVNASGSTLGALYPDSATDALVFAQTAGAGNLKISSNGSVLLQPTSGNVGIGTTTPLGKLDVYNNSG
jgi:hypothetical protein